QVMHLGARHLALRDGMWMQPEPLLHLGPMAGDLSLPVAYSSLYAAGDTNALQDRTGTFSASVYLLFAGCGTTCQYDPPPPPASSDPVVGRLEIHALYQHGSWYDGVSGSLLGRVGHAWVSYHPANGESSMSWGMYKGGYAASADELQSPDPYAIDQEAYRASAVYGVDVTQGQFDKVTQFVDDVMSMEEGYDALQYNCADFAQGMFESSGYGVPDYAIRAYDAPFDLISRIENAAERDAADDPGDIKPPFFSAKESQP
ncbi:MAG: hypothetical protein KTR31_07505, partial [Myxococcales bacterium]|nr:hypothetical protein [Myxococcales bacterium]